MCLSFFLFGDEGCPQLRFFLGVFSPSPTTGRVCAPAYTLPLPPLAHTHVCVRAAFNRDEFYNR